MLVEHADARDRVAIVAYAGSAGRGPAADRGRRASDTILGAIDRLAAGGSTNGGAGIELAYRPGDRATSSRAASTA